VLEKSQVCLIVVVFRIKVFRDKWRSMAKWGINHVGQ